MKKIQIILILILFLWLFPPVFSSSTVTAQSPETSNTSDESESGLIVSPSVLIVEDKDQGKTFTVKITNNSAETYQLSIAETRIIRSEEGRLVPVTSDKDKNFLEINASELTLTPNSEESFRVRLKLSAKITDRYPGILISRSTTNKKKSSSESGAVIINSIIIPVLTQNFQGELKADNNLNIDYSVLSPNNSFKVTGELANTGEKFFDPSGSLSIYKDGVKLYEHQITSQVQGLFFPEEKKSYNFTWLNNLDLLQKIGNYTFESKVNAVSANKTFVSKVQFFYLPIDILLLLLAAGLFLLFILIKIGQRISRQRNYYEKEEFIPEGENILINADASAEKTSLNE